jgi:hypothetical protein
MTWEAYLESKKIDSTRFKTAEPERWQEWHDLFAEMSPASFTAQKLYLINSIRRKYLLTIREESAPKTSALRPVIKSNPKIN